MGTSACFEIYRLRISNEQVLSHLGVMPQAAAYPTPKSSAYQIRGRFSGVFWLQFLSSFASSVWVPCILGQFSPVPCIFPCKPRPLSESLIAAFRKCDIHFPLHPHSPSLQPLSLSCPVVDSRPKIKLPNFECIAPKYRQLF